MSDDNRLPSCHQINDEVRFDKLPHVFVVESVTFTESKVFYGLRGPDGIIREADSAEVKPNYLKVV